MTAAILHASIWVFLGTLGCVTVLGTLIGICVVIANGNQTAPRRPSEDGRGEGATS